MKLLLCEKPSQARDIARIVGATSRRDGYYAATVGATAVTWCVGHLVKLADPEAYDPRYKRWALEDLPIIPAERWKLEIAQSTAAQFRVVKQLLARAPHVIIATDADREGEMIARELLDLCAYRGSVQRLWLSALNDASIRKALDNLRPGNETFPLYQAALARARADWLIGINLTRLFTLLGRQSGFQGVLSVGRVQTPTLRLVVDRDRQIESFVPAPFWTIDITLAAHGRKFIARWLAPRDVVDADGRCTNHAAALAAAARLRQCSIAQVGSVQTEHLREPAPLPLDLSTLQQLSSAILGFDVMDTLSIAQSLYETHKATTYPRSDCQYLPENMHAEAPQVLQALVRTDSTLRPIVDVIEARRRSRAWNDKKVTAHHAIIPTSDPADLAAMSEKEAAIYKLIRAYYLAQFMPDYEYDRTLAVLIASGCQLQARGKVVTADGWRRLLRETTPSEQPHDPASDQGLPPLVIGQSCQIGGVQLRDQETTPPRPFTQGELVRAMKRAGIGTEATRAGVVQSLIQRRYLVSSRKSTHSTDAGRTLIDAVPPAVADPGMTAHWEKQLELVAASRLTLAQFVLAQTEWLVAAIKTSSGRAMTFARTPSPGCPICTAPTVQRRGRRGLFWSCTRYPECNGVARGLAPDSIARTRH